MERQTTCFVTGALANVLRISKWFGAAPLQFVKHGNGWRMSFSRNFCFPGCIAMGVCHICALWTFASAVLYGPGGGRSVVVVVVLVSILVSGTVVYGAPRRMRRLITCLNQVEKILSDLNIQHWPKPWSRKLNAFMTTWATASALINIMDFFMIAVVQHKVSSTIWLNALPLTEIILDCINAVGRAQFLLITIHVQTCFCAVNDCIRTLLRDLEKNNALDEKSPYKAKNTFQRVDFNFKKSKKLDFDVVSQQQYPHETIKRVSSAYARACDVVHIVDRTHGLMLLLMLAFFLLTLISKFYNLITSIADEGFSRKFSDFVYFEVVQFSWCIYHMINLVMIIEPCNMTHTEMETTRELVSQAMRYTRSAYDPLMVELERFCRLLTINQVSYRPLYVTTMTRGLVLTILGSIITYLVILIDLK